LGRADATVAVTEQQRRSMLKAAPHTRVVRNAVTVLDTIDDVADEPGLESVRTAARPRIAVIGRLSPEKGPDVFLRAASLLAGRGIPFTGLLAGDGPEREKLERLAGDLQLGKRVRFLGRIANISHL